MTNALHMPQPAEVDAVPREALLDVISAAAAIQARAMARLVSPLGQHEGAACASVPTRTTNHRQPMVRNVPPVLEPYRSELRELRGIEACVYFLINHGEVVYVGRTAALFKRVAAHSADKTFDRVIYIPVRRYQDLGEVEGRFIRELRPRLNVRIPGRSIDESEEELNG